MKKALIFLALLGLGASQLCAQEFSSAEEMCPDVAMDLVVEAKESVHTTDMGSFHKSLQKQNYDLVIDVREPSEFASGHIPGATNIPRGLIEFMIWKEIGYPQNSATDQKIYLYCNSGGRASLSGKALMRLGFGNVTVVDMQLSKWAEAGYPIEKGG